MNRSVILIVFALVSGCLTVYTPLYTVDVPTTATLFDYSPNHQFLAAATQNSLTIINGHTGLKRQVITIEQPRSISAFAFSKDSHWLGVGMKNGEVVIYEYIGNAFVDINKTYKADKDSTVKSMCFTSDGKGIVFGVLQDQVIFWHLEQQRADTINFGQQLVMSVTCSPVEPGTFVVSGGINTRPKVAFYSNSGNATTLIHELTDLPWQDASLAVAYSENGQKLYIGNEDGSVSICITETYSLMKLNITELKGKPISKIVLSTNQKYIGFASISLVFTAVNDSESGQYIVQQFNSKGGSIALTSNGGYIFIIDENKNPTVLSQCPKQQYFVQETGECKDCQEGCSLCQTQPTQCYGCIDKYVLQANTCVRCSVGCLKCSSPTVCQVCDSHFINVDSACVCQHGYFLKDQTCQKCSVGCDICNDQKHCLECRPKFDFKDDQCVCSKGSFLDGQDCTNCIRGCDSCENANQCIVCSKQSHYVLDNNICQCDKNYHFVDDGQNCVCQAGYYYDSRADYCLPCWRGCATCISSQQCLTCKDGLELKDGVCQCKDKTQYIDVDGVCKSCGDAIKYCIQCEEPTKCTACQPDIHRVEKKGQCECEDNYFPDADDVCKPCDIVGCLECEDLQKCSTCDAANFWQKDPSNNQCKCMKGFSRFQDTCIKCGTGCKSCNPEECLECDQDNHWILDNGQCLCQPSYYQDGSQCKQCMVGCLDCSRADFCNVCDASQHFQVKSGICTCESTYFLNATSCLTCSVIPHCLQCSNAQNCLKCVQKFIVNATTHKCVCPDGTYVSNDKCVQCPAGCKTCVAADHCITCEDGYVFKNNVCVEKKKNKIQQMALIILGVLALATIIHVLQQKMLLKSYENHRVELGRGTLKRRLISKSRPTLNLLRGINNLKQERKMARNRTDVKIEANPEV